MSINVDRIIQKSKEIGTSDIHLVCGLPPKCRKDGKVISLEGEPPLTHEDCEEMAYQIAGDDYDSMRRIGEINIARSVYPDIRTRINIYRQQGHVSAAIRILSDRIPELTEIGVPPAVMEFPNFRNGLVLVTGETGSGKSTTLAAVLNSINKNSYQHIITLEDPIEYVYNPIKSVVNQREVGVDTESYADGLRAILREDPDVILIGEMNDLNTIETALTAAETGHLVFATLHTSSAADSVDRIVAVFPEGKQKQVRLQLSQSLRAVLSQQLLPKAGGSGRVLACELMMVNSAIRNLIREGKTPQIANTLATSASEGSITMDNYIIMLLKSKIIDMDTALAACRDATYVRRSLGAGNLMSGRM